MQKWISHSINSFQTNDRTFYSFLITHSNFQGSLTRFEILSHLSTTFWDINWNKPKIWDLNCQAESFRNTGPYIYIITGRCGIVTTISSDWRHRGWLFLKVCLSTEARDSLCSVSTQADRFLLATPWWTQPGSHFLTLYCWSPPVPIHWQPSPPPTPTPFKDTNRSLRYWLDV